MKRLIIYNTSWVLVSQVVQLEGECENDINNIESDLILYEV